ncbi:MAG: CidA/LrgA family protein [Roseinatronobacter sp.]
MIHAIALILLCQLTGETVVRLSGVPVPGPVLGLALLFGLMLASPRIAALVQPVAEGILRHLSLLFVPAGVGVVGHLGALGAFGGELALVLVLSTLLALVAGVVTFVVVARLNGGGNGGNEPDEG